ncbi:MAG: glucose-1-phosphate cytidylyltransferase [Bryobacteraceae bacterium]|nr:glucose-1-phosphate cytidylyltransferase [Bryobacteraceae bacterium]
MKAVILAGGMGSRLSEETERVPKPLVEVGSKPILWHIMKIYSAHGINDFILCLGYKGYVIKEYFTNYFLHACDVTVDLSSRSVEVHQNRSEPWRITMIDTGLTTNTGGRLRRIAPMLTETFCMTYGDGVSDTDISGTVEFHRQHGKLATVTAIKPPGRFGVLSVQGDKVTHFGEKIDSEQSTINGGFFVLEPEALNRVSSDEISWEREPMEQLASEDQLRAWHHSGFWQPMDTLRDKRLLEELWASGNAPWKVW